MSAWICVHVYTGEPNMKRINQTEVFIAKLEASIRSLGGWLLLNLKWRGVRTHSCEVVSAVNYMCSFIVEFTSRTPDAEKDSESVQAFLTTTEGAFEAHPLFVDATDEELDSAGEVSPSSPSIWCCLLFWVICGVREEVSNENGTSSKITSPLT